MRHPVTRYAVAAAASTLALTALTALSALSVAAHAAERTVHDAAGDVAHGVDLRSVKVVNEKNVRVVLQHDDLVRSPGSGAGVTVYLDTDRDRKGPEYAFVAGLYEGTDYALLRTDGWRLRHGKRVAAGSHRLRIDYGADISRVRFSRAALDRPHDVRVSVRAGGQQPDGDQVRDWLTERRHLTAWVARG